MVHGDKFMTHREFIGLIDETKVVAAIAAAEGLSTGEIRLFVKHRAVADALAEARAHFTKLGMTQTAQRNAVLIFVAPLSRTFAIIGDEQVHLKCGAELWQHITEDLGAAFRAGEWTQGLLHAIRQIGAELTLHFPRTADHDPNELPDAILRDEED